MSSASLSGSVGDKRWLAASRTPFVTRHACEDAAVSFFACSQSVNARREICVFLKSRDAEKEPSTRRTLHADVNTRKGANGELFLYDSIHDQEGVVNTSDEKTRGEL